MRDPECIQFLTNYHMIAIQETWSDTEIFFDGYSAYQIRAEKIRYGRSKGGLVILISNSFNYVVDNCLLIKDKIIYMKITILNPHLTEKDRQDFRTLDLCNLYFSPVSKEDQDNIIILNDIIEKQQDLTKYTPILIMGDFNARLKKKQEENFHWEHIHYEYKIPETKRLNNIGNKRGVMLYDFMNTRLCRQMNGRFHGDVPAQFTYISGKKKSIIDYMLIDCQSWNKIEDFYIEPRPESDHNPLICYLRLDLGELKEEENLEIREIEIRNNRIITKSEVGDRLEECKKDVEIKNLYEIIIGSNNDNKNCIKENRSL